MSGGSSTEREARFEQLFKETRSEILGYAVRRTRSPEDAADVLGETFLIAWRKLDTVPSGDEARLWLYGVARNVLRRGPAHENTLDIDRLAFELGEAVDTSRPEEENQTPELWGALERLPGPQRDVILLAAWEELTPREIATITGSSVNLVRVRLHRARAHLKRELANRSADNTRRRLAPTSDQAA